MVIAGETTQLKTPVDVALKLHEHAEKALTIAASLEPANSRELQTTLHDIKTMALLGEYYAYKIAGSASLALYRETKDKSYQSKAIEELTQALES